MDSPATFTCTSTLKDKRETTTADCAFSNSNNPRCSISSERRNKSSNKRSLLPGSMQLLILCFLLQFLLTFAQGQGYGGTLPGASLNERKYFSVSEGREPGTRVGAIEVQDGLQYKFSTEPAEFRLDSNTGEIFTSMVIDRESLDRDEFDLTITSVPNSRHLIEATIKILDINDNAPTFGVPSISVEYSESNLAGTQVLLETATDKDVDENDVTSQYEIVSGNDAGKFKLVLMDASKTLLYLENNSPLDREERDFYQLNISAQDGGDPVRYGYLLVNITVQDTNDNPPVFDQSGYKPSVNETSPPETSIIQVRATDADVGKNADVTYKIVEEEMTYQFKVDPKTGVVRNLRKLDCPMKTLPAAVCNPREEECKYKSCEFNIEAKDGGTPVQRGAALVTVTLIDENDNDPEINFSYFPQSSNAFALIDESARIFSPVAYVSVTDQDIGVNAQAEAQITKGNELGHFMMDRLNKNGWMVKVAAKLDREVISKYNLTIVAHDKGTPTRSSTAFLIILINDINDHEPKFQQPAYSAQLSELVPIGSFVAGMTATDNDTGINAQITYRIASGNDLGWFQIDPSTGLVTTVKRLDREMQQVVRLSVTAKDGAAKPAQSTANLTVNIFDENDEVPTFSQDVYEINLVEGPAIGRVILSEQAVDRDQGKLGSVRYSLDPDVENNYPGLFQLNPLSGVITTLRALDREEFSTMDLVLYAADQGSPPQIGSTKIKIRVGDLNDNEPKFYPVMYYGSVFESDPAGAKVLQVKATDPDAGEAGTVRYSFTQGSDQRFQIDEVTGWISTKEKLDKSIKSEYRLTVSARDLGNSFSPSMATIEINVMDGTESIPAFSQMGDYVFSVSEDSGKGSPSVGRRVGQVEAQVSVKYTIVNGDPRGLFAINQNTGDITTTAAVDREYQAFYSLQVIASASGVFSQCRVNISVTDINDNAPSFHGHIAAHGEILENLPVGHDVFLAQAYDPDSGNNAKLQYTLETGSSLFRIDEDTGMIVLARPLSETSDTTFSMTVTVKDSGSPQYSAQLIVTISVIDVNDHTPLFQQTGYEVTVEESRPVNDLFFKVEAEDDDSGRNGQVFYEIVKGNVGNRFGIFPDGQLYISHSLDRETHDLYVLTLRAFDMGVDSRSSLANVTIHILDDNDNSPVFSNQTYVMDIAEGEEIGNYVGTVYASDRDTGSNAELFYSFEGRHDGFEIQAKTGVIVNSLTFDREEQVAKSKVDYVTLSVIVTDHGNPQRSDKAAVRVYIQDSNDNAPEFQQKVYSPSVFENAEVDTEVVRVQAIDLDAGQNAVVTYSILSGNLGDRFKINNGGLVQVNRAGLDRETKDSYLLVVMATDGGYPSLNATCEVHVTILDYNDNAPVFVDMDREYSINENAMIGEVITHVSAIDKDLGNKALVSYGIVDHIPAVFTIDSKSGKITLASILDYETKSSYSLNISASDHGTPSLSSYILLTINLIDYNDNTPRFTDALVIRSISEEVAIGSTVTKVTADDPDSGINGQLRYSISRQVPAGQNFSIDSVTGQIKTATVMDRETTKNFKLTIVATDQALPLDSRKSAEKMVTIVIDDVNDNSPQFISQTSVDIVQGAQPNTQVMHVKAVDPDEGINGMVSYEISSGDRQIFSIEENTGKLYLRSSLSQQILSYDLTIMAKDAAVNPRTQMPNPRSSYTQIRVFVRSSDDNGPIFSESSYSGDVNENKPADTNIVAVSASYNGGSTGVSRRQIEYAITSVKASRDGETAMIDQPRYFKINPLSGQITTTQPLDRELGYELFQVIVYAIELGIAEPKTRSAKVEIRLLDEPDSPPVFVAGVEEQIQVAEDVQAGYIVTTVDVTDADEQQTIKYDINDGGNGHFDIDASTGEITVVSALDREKLPVYELLVMATDGTLTSTASVTVILTDVNDQPPKFSQQWYSFTVPESTQTGLSIGQVRATDADLGNNAQVTYSITSHWGRDKFSLDPNSGVLRLIGSLDYEQHEHYVLTVRAQDSGAPAPLSSTATVYVNVRDDNNHAPVFDMSSYSAGIREDALVGEPVTTVSATDSDAGENSVVRYSIVGGDPGRMFSIDATTGELTVARTLDREDQGYYNLAVQAEDQAASNRASSTTVVTIDVQDANDNAPQFQFPKQITVPENSPTGASVSKLIATDLDTGDNGKILYTLLSDPGNMFVLGENDGVLRISQELDRETVDRYDLKIRASDKGSPVQSTEFSLTVIVGDENDHEPVFDQKEYKTEVDENVAVGTRLLQFQATDEDIGMNAELRYIITSGDDNHDFYVNPKTGALSVKKWLDYERKQEYNFEVTVHDLGTTQYSDTATVTITLRDVNDCAPIFHDAPYTAFVHENVPAANLPVHVLRVTARDEDMGGGGELTYSFAEGDTEMFDIDSTTGEITATKTLDREETAEYTFVVQAMDKAVPRLSGITPVTVKVGDANDNPPRFLHTSYNGRVRENLGPGSVTARISAEDSDAGKNAQIRYSLVEDAHGKFRIDPDSGVITTAVVLDREEHGSYHLVVMATDQGRLPLSSTASVLVLVEDDNDSTPQFLQSQYTHYLRDTTTTGSFVAGVTAVDADTQENGQIEYNIVDESARTTLLIDSVTGVITAKTLLTQANVPRSFYVRAADKGSPSRSSQVLVTLKFLPAGTTNFPQFRPMQQEFELDEDINTGYVVVLTSANSNRPGASLRYHIIGGNQEDTFTMSGGQLKVSRPLDFERVRRYSLWLVVQDSSVEPALEDFIGLTIDVRDVNDCVPVFNGLYHNATVPETERWGYSVITVTASDCDSGENGRVSYALAPEGNEEGAFQVNSATGEITTKKFLDRETMDRYLLVLTATDHGEDENTATATVDIAVLDKNDQRPVFTTHFHTRIPENAANGSFVLKITSTDGDIGDNALHVYTLKVNPDNKFAIDPYSGNITVAGPLDRESKDEYILKVEANDRSFKAETDVSIYVLDVNDNAPQFQQTDGYKFMIAELQPANTPVGKVSASDLDASGPNADIYYRLEPASGEFEIDPATGVISARKVFDFKPDGQHASPENVHQLTVVASDRGEPAMVTRTTVTITVQQANRNAPVFDSERYTAAVSENAMTGTSVVMVTASDVGTGLNALLAYSIESGNGSSLFRVDTDSGIVTVGQTLQSNRDKTYYIQIKATDHGQPPKSAVTNVYIQVAPVNTYQPEFSGSEDKFRVTIAENYPIGEVVSKVTATDRDVGINGRVQYFLTGGDEYEKFMIDRTLGILKVAQSLDYETRKVHYLNVTASDSGLIPKEKTRLMTVFVTDVNDSPPQFAMLEYDAYVRENAPRDTSVFAIHATDADSPSMGSIAYYMTGDNVAADIFEVDSLTGLITTKGDIDYEMTSDYNVQIKAINPGSALSGTTTIRVHVIGENEFRPVFQEREYSFEVSESAEMGQSIGKVVAQDRDQGQEGVVFYYLVGDSNMEGFVVDAESGDVRISKQIDREATSEIRLNVLAKNSGPVLGNDTDQCVIRIVVGDANDPPKFEQKLYEGHVLEGDDVGTPVIKVTAVDNDEKPEDRSFSYTIKSGNVGNAFRINPGTGEIASNIILDREAIGVYNLTVAAVDTGIPPQTGSALVKVYVGDRNDNGPHFVPAIPVGSFKENAQPQSRVGLNLNEYTHDLDLDPNQEPYKYRLVDHMDIFEVGITSGYVRTKTRLDRERFPNYKVKVEVGDNGNPVMTSTLTFSIDVEDENDNPSSSRPLEVHTFAFDNKFSGYKVASVEPNDIDTVGDYQCQVTGGDLTQFSIRTACDLYANQVKTSGSYNVDISGSDGIHTAVDYSVQIKFSSFNQSLVGFYHTTILKLDQVTASEFLQRSYIKFIEEVNASVGPSGEVILYNMREQGQEDGSTSVILLLAAKQDGNYLTRNQLAQKITDSKMTIQNTAKVTISTIGYSPCQKDIICVNGAECTYTLDTQAGEYVYHSSPELAFTSPKILLSTTCNCREGFQGSNCEVPISKCQQQPCQNGGSCRDKPNGYECECKSDYQGDRCEIHIDVCDSNPCKHGQCVVKDLGYMCNCDFGYFGDLCESSAINFQSGSFIEYGIKLDQQQNQIEMEVATIRKNALLFYAPVNEEEFMAVEIVDGEVEFSFSLGSNATRLRVPRLVNDGAWYRIVAGRTRNVGTLKVTACGDGGQKECEKCSDNDPKCYMKAAHGNFENLDAGGSFYIGGVPDFSLLLDHPHRVSSSGLSGGCLRHLSVDLVDLMAETPKQQELIRPCNRTRGGACATAGAGEEEEEGPVCGDGGAVCKDEWDQHRCECPEGTAGDKCQLESSFSLGSGGSVTLTTKPWIQQQEALAAGRSRSKRSPANYRSRSQRSTALRSRSSRSVLVQRSLSITFKTVDDRAVLLYSQQNDGAFTMLYLDNKRVHYSSQSGGSMLSHDQEVSNGEWHTVKLTIADNTATLTVDDNDVSKSFDTILQDPVSLQMTSLTLGTPAEKITVPGTAEELKGVEACLDELKIDGESLPLSGSSERYNIVTEGEVSSSCAAFMAVINTSGPPITIVVAVIVSFFVLVIVVILISCLVIRHRRKEKLKAQRGGGGVGGYQNGKMNGVVVDKSDGRSSHHDSGFTENGGNGGGNNGHFNEAQIIRQHIEAEMQQHVFQEREVAGERRPDIIGQEACPPAPTPQPGGGMDNIGFHQEEPAEHYDIDNASSIAPSDLVDVVSHYKRYRSGLLNNHAYPPQSNRHHHHHHRPSPNHLLLTQRNHSPASLSSQSRTSPNIMGPQPPAKSPLTINNIQHYNQLQQQHRVTPTQQLARGTSPLPRGVSPSAGILPNKRGPSPSLRSTPLSGLNGLYAGNMSDSSLSTNAPPPPRPNSKLKQPISALPRGVTPPVQGLTVEEVNRLNARHKLSPVSTVDAVSTSSEENAQNNINRTEFSHSDLIETAGAAVPRHSSSEEDNGSNDSFTCSEVDYDDSKPRFNGVGGGGINGLMPGLGNGGPGLYPGRLARVDEIDTDTTMSRRTVNTTRDTDSISTFFTSDDEPSMASHHLHKASKLPNGALNWDYLLNWGPNFEKLVGVFSDIAQLPDSDTDNSQRKGRLLSPSPLSKPQAPQAPPPRPPKSSNTPHSNTQSPLPVGSSPLPHMFTNGLSASPAMMRQSPLIHSNIPNSPKSRSPITSSTSSTPTPAHPHPPQSYNPPPLSHTTHPKSTIPVGSVPPHPRSPHPKSPVPLPNSNNLNHPHNSHTPSPTIVDKPTTNGHMQNGDVVNESYLEEYV